MKKTLILAVALLSVCSFAVAQKKNNKPIAAAAPAKDSNTSINKTETFDLAVNGTTPGSYAMTLKDSTMKVYDSLATIKGLIKGAQELQNQTSQQTAYIRQCETTVQQQNLELEASREILRHVNGDGTIKDRKRFDAAVDKYQQITGNK